MEFDTIVLSDLFDEDLRMYRNKASNCQAKIKLKDDGFGVIFIVLTISVWWEVLSSFPSKDLYLHFSKILYLYFCDISVR